MSTSAVSRRAMLGSLLAPSAVAAASPSVAIQHVTVVDVGNGATRPNQTIVVRGDRIASVGGAGSTAQTINGRGWYAIPGLWDMHVHLWTDPPLFGLYLKNGITGIRDMGSPPVRTRNWRKQISSGQKIGPRILTSGTPIDGPGPRMPEMPTLTAENPNEARKAGDEWEKESVDFIKVLSHLSRDSYQALTAAARQMRWTLVGHLPDEVSATEAVYARQESIEHMFGILLSCSREETSLRGRKIDLKTSQRILDSYDQARAHDLCDLMRRYETYLTPTLTLHRRMSQMGMDELMQEPQLALIPAVVKKSWTDPREKVSPEATAFLGRQFERHQMLIRDMQMKGVRLLAGTDAGDPYVVPGASLHDELAQMVAAGLSPLQALQTATRNPAAFLHLEDRLGSVERGRYADIVLLEANPLADIRNTRKVAGVVMAGRFLSHDQLETLARV